MLNRSLATKKSPRRSSGCGGKKKSWRRNSKENQPAAADTSREGPPKAQNDSETKTAAASEHWDGQSGKRRRPSLTGVLISPPAILRDAANTSAVGIERTRNSAAESPSVTPDKAFEPVEKEEEKSDKHPDLPDPPEAMDSRQSPVGRESFFDMSSIVDSIFVEEQEECLELGHQEKKESKDEVEGQGAEPHHAEVQDHRAIPKKKVSWGDDQDTQGLAEWKIFRSSQSPESVGAAVTSAAGTPEEGGESLADSSVQQKSVAFYVDELSLQLSDSDDQEEQKKEVGRNSSAEKDHQELSSSDRSRESSEPGDKEDERDMFGASLSDSMLNEAMEGKREEVASGLSSTLLLGLNTMSCSQFSADPSPILGNDNTTRGKGRLRDRGRKCDSKKKVINAGNVATR